MEALITALLRGERATWPFPGDVSTASRFLSVARSHGVLPLLGHRIADSAVSDGWPAELIDACRKSTLPHAAIELARRAELCRVLTALNEAQVKPLVLKGGALAYTHYPNPALRPRGDTDLLIAPSAKGRTDETLLRLGYTHGGGMSGNLVSYQASWSRVDGPFAMHHLDVHWRINNSQILANVLTYVELERRAICLPLLGPHALGLSPVHAMLLACMHRAGHRNAPYYVDGVACSAADRLIWIYDIHLLYSRMSEAEIAEFVELAAAKRIKAICRQSLETSIARFATEVAPTVLRQLTAVGRAEPSALYLSAGPVRQMLGELFAIDNVADRVRWLGETAFPAPAYMLQKYPDSQATWLPVLYARRGAEGLWRLAASLRRERAP